MTLVNVPIQGIKRSLNHTSKNNPNPDTWGAFSRTWTYSLTHPPANNPPPNIAPAIFVQRLTISLQNVNDVGHNGVKADMTLPVNNGDYTYFEWLSAGHDTWSWPSPSPSNVFYGWHDKNGQEHDYRGTWVWTTEVRAYPNSDKIRNQGDCTILHMTREHGASPTSPISS